MTAAVTIPARYARLIAEELRKRNTTRADRKAQDIFNSWADLLDPPPGMSQERREALRVLAARSQERHMVTVLRECLDEIDRLRESHD